jgi:hypothetical protein
MAEMYIIGAKLHHVKIINMNKIIHLHLKQ